MPADQESVQLLIKGEIMNRKKSVSFGIRKS